MSTSISEKEFISYVIDLMQSVGPVRAKSMFGAHGISLEGLTFGLVIDGTLYFKVDSETENEFIARDLTAFSYSRNGKNITISYYQAPEEVLEDVDAMNHWANKAYSAALRTAAKK